MNPRSGLSLIEMMLAVTITSIVMLSVYPLIRQSSMISSRSEVRSRTMTETRSGMELILRVLEQAKAGTWVISSEGTCPASRIDVRRASDNQIQSFILAKNQILFTDGPQAPKPIISNVRFVHFTGEKADPAMIRVSLQVEAPIPGTDPYSLFLANREVRLTE